MTFPLLELIKTVVELEVWHKTQAQEAALWLGWVNFEILEIGGYLNFETPPPPVILYLLVSPVAHDTPAPLEGREELHKHAEPAIFPDCISSGAVVASGISPKICLPLFHFTAWA